MLHYKFPHIWDMIDKAPWFPFFNTGVSFQSTSQVCHYCLLCNVYCLVKGCHKVKLDRLKSTPSHWDFFKSWKHISITENSYIFVSKGCDEEGVGKAEDRGQYGGSHGGINTIIHIQVFLLHLNQLSWLLLHCVFNKNSNQVFLTSLTLEGGGIHTIIKFFS